MSGDLRRLAAAADPPHQLQGLRARLAGALSSLPLLIRQAGGASDSAQMNALRSALARDDWKTLRAGLEGLLKHHPLDLGGILPVAATPQRLALGAAIHRQACAACHDHPSAQAQLPAHDLFKQAIDMPPEEFAARLLNGVRGDPSTGQRNPFGALEIGALIAYYRCGADRIAVHRAQGSNGAMKDCEGRAP